MTLLATSEAGDFITTAILPMSKFLAFEVSQWIWNEQIHFDVQISDDEISGRFWSIKREDVGVGLYDLTFLFKFHPSNVYYALGS